MKKPIANKIKLALSDTLSGADPGDFETITLRPSEDVGAMISALNQLLGLPVSTLFADEISEKLCQLLAESKENQSIVEDMLDEPIQAGSALSLLVSTGAVRPEPRL